MLKLQHHIRINPYPTQEQAHLSIEQLWSGLVLRVLEPMRFTIGLDGAQVTQVNERQYRRTLSFGAHSIADEVALEPQHSVRFVTEATEQIPSGQLYYEIQDDPTHGLVLLCEYATAFPEPQSDEEQQLLETIKSAYRMADEDMVRIIREYAQMVRH